jgi:hypothetical protein
MRSLELSRELSHIQRKSINQATNSQASPKGYLLPL